MSCLQKNKSLKCHSERAGESFWLAERPLTAFGLTPEVGFIDA